MKTEASHGVTGYNANQFSEGWGGLTKREYFAAMAMQGLIANAPDGHIGNSIEGSQLATQWADSLITSLNTHL